MKKNLLLICGGGSTEHEISLLSAQYVQRTIEKNKNYNILCVEITKEGVWRDKSGVTAELNQAKELISKMEELHMHFAIPVIHGFPGETGDIQSYFEMIKLPYLGCSSEASKICFNKVTTKLWLSALAIPNTPYTFLSNIEEISKAEEFFNNHGDVFVKAASQGSSVGCYHVTKKSELKDAVQKAFGFSNQVLIEKTLKGRELEVSVYEYKGQLKVSNPGEIICPEGEFYSYDEKYSDKSHTQTVIEAQNLTPETVAKIKKYAEIAFKGIGLRHLSRIDFFLTPDGEIFMNEINTFPGMTPISMFPKMMEASGDSFEEFLKHIIETAG